MLIFTRLAFLTCTIFFTISELSAQNKLDYSSHYNHTKEPAFSERVFESKPFSSRPFQGDDFIDQAGPPVDNGLPIEDYAWVLIPLAGALLLKFRKSIL